MTAHATRQRAESLDLRFPLPQSLDVTRLRHIHCLWLESRSSQVSLGLSGGVRIPVLPVICGGSTQISGWLSVTCARSAQASGWLSVTGAGSAQTSGWLSVTCARSAQASDCCSPSMAGAASSGAAAKTSSVGAFVSLILQVSLTRRTK